MPAFLHSITASGPPQADHVDLFLHGGFELAFRHRPVHETHVDRLLAVKRSPVRNSFMPWCDPSFRQADHGDDGGNDTDADLAEAELDGLHGDRDVAAPTRPSPPAKPGR